jgi:hypothetical protein
MPAHLLSVFWACSHNKQLKYAQEYAECLNQAQQDEFVRCTASRWFEFAHLLYFDVCWVIVIDPGVDHLGVGLVKMHFYHIWIKLKVLQKTKELQQFHSILSKVVLSL